MTEAGKRKLNGANEFSTDDDDGKLLTDKVSKTQIIILDEQE